MDNKKLDNVIFVEAYDAEKELKKKEFNGINYNIYLFQNNFVKYLINKIIEKIKNIDELDMPKEMDIDVSKIYYRQVDFENNNPRELDFQYEDINYFYGVKVEENHEEIFEEIIKVFEQYDIKCTYTGQTNFLRYWVQEKGILSIKASLFDLLTMYYNEKEYHSEREEKHKEQLILKKQ